MWITEADREKAERTGCTVVDPPSIIATHLTEILKRHAAEVLGRQEVQAILDTLKTDYPAVVEEVRKSLSTGEIQKVLQGLLGERVSVRNMVVILETLADYAGVTKDGPFLVEKVRQALGRQISLQYCDEAKTLRVLTIEPSLEKRIIDSRVETGRGVTAGLEPGAAPAVDHRPGQRGAGGAGTGLPRGGAVLRGGPAAGEGELGAGDPAPGGAVESRGRGRRHRRVARGNQAGERNGGPCSTSPCRRAATARRSRR